MARHAHLELDEEARDRIALFVLDGMRAEERTRFEEHLTHCPVCREDVERLASFVTDLVLAGPESDPPPGLKERVLERARQCGFALRPLGRRSWHPTDVAGVVVSQLWSDTASGRQTILIRMEAGASIPTHRHPGPEECFVIEGDLSDGALELGAGDYVRYRAGTQHSIATRGGCLLFVTTFAPEPLAGAS